MPKAPKILQHSKTKVWRLKFTIKGKEYQFSFGHDKRTANKFQRRIASIYDNKEQFAYLPSVLAKCEALGKSKAEIMQIILDNANLSDYLMTDEKVKATSVIDVISKFMSYYAELVEENVITESTLSYYEASLIHFVNFCKEKNIIFLLNFKADSGKKFTAWLRRQRNKRDDGFLTNGTVASYVKAVRKFFEWANRESYYNNPNPIAKLRQEVRTLNFNKSEFELIVSNADERTAKFLTFAFKTGWRLDQILSINLNKNVDWEKELCLRKGQKKGKTEWVQLINDSIEELEFWKNKDVSEFAFSLKRGCKASPKNLRKSVAKSCEKIGIEKIIIHNIRRFFITSELKLGTPPQFIASYLGVSLKMIIDIYNDLEASTSANELNKNKAFFKLQA